MIFVLVGLHILFPVRKPTWKEVCRKKRPEKCRFKDKTTQNSKHEPGSWCCWTAWGLSLWRKGHVLLHHTQSGNLQKPRQFPKRHRDVVTEIQKFSGIKTTCRRPGSTPTTTIALPRWRTLKTRESWGAMWPRLPTPSPGALPGQSAPSADGHTPQAQEPDTQRRSHHLWIPLTLRLPKTQPLSTEVSLRNTNMNQ